MADVTGGQAYFPQSMKEVEKIYDRIVTELESRYLLGYVSSDPRTDGGWRPVEVRLTRADLKGSRSACARATTRRTRRIARRGRK